MWRRLKLSAIGEFFLSQPPLWTPDITQADIACTYKYDDVLYVYLSLHLANGDEDWMTLLFHDPIRVDHFRDEVDNLADQEPLSKPELYEELYPGRGLAIRQASQSRYLLEYLANNPAIQSTYEDARHIRVDTGWSELHVLTDSELRMVNGVFKPKEIFFDAH